MPFVPGYATRLYIAGKDVSYAFRDAKVQVKAATFDVTSLGATGKQYLPGQVDAQLDLEGFWDGPVSTPDSSVDKLLASLLPSTGFTGVVGWGPDQRGARLTGIVAIGASYEIDAPVSDAAKVKVSAQLNARDALVTIAPLAQVSQNGSTTPWDYGAARTAVVGYLVVTQVAGTLTVVLEGSADGTTFTQLGSFGGVTAPTCLRTVVNGNRYVRASWTLSSGGNATFLVGISA